MQNRLSSVSGRINNDARSSQPGMSNAQEPAAVAYGAVAGVASDSAERNGRALLLGTFLGRDEQREFRRGGNRAYATTAWLYLGMASGLIAAYFAVTYLHLAWRLPVLALVFVWIGWSQFSLSNGLHEGLHRNFGEHQREWLTALLTAYPIGLTLSGYRRIHFAHHRHFSDPGKDPDFAEYSNFPESRLQLLARFAWMGSGIPAVRQFFRQILRRAPPEAGAPASESTRGELLPLLMTQAVIFALIALTLGPVYYFLLWVLPLATLGKLLSSTRLLCEHGTPDVSTRGCFVVRTILGGGVRTNLLGMYRFNLHGEHHLYPSVPYAMLDSLQQRHAIACQDADYVSRLACGYECFAAGGYIGLLRLWFKQLPWTTRA